MKTNTFLPCVLSQCSRFIGAMLIVALMMPVVAFSQTVYDNPATVNLGATASTFRILAASAATIHTGCTVTGNVGCATVTNNGTVNGDIWVTTLSGGGSQTATHAIGTTLTDAQNDLTAAYTDAAGRIINSSTGAALAVELGGVILGRGVYSGGTFTITGPGTLTLTGTETDIFIFKVGTTLGTFGTCHVTMAGTALASNVFWQVGSSATIIGDFKGNILAQTSITQTSGTIDGKLLARDGAADIGGTSVLPVELTSFTVALNKNAVELNWNTATEVNNYGFEVERAIRNEELGIGNWKKIGFVQGNGNSNSPKEYSFIDKTISYGSYAYRLKQLDNDGAFEYSKVVEADFKPLQIFELSQNYPNPFNPTTKISYSIPVDSRVQLLVYRITGEQVKSLVNEYQTAGIYTVDFDASVLSSGIYFYKIIANNFLQIKKMSVLK